jgi:hypothetical protein
LRFKRSDFDFVSVLCLCAKRCLVNVVVSYYSAVVKMSTPSEVDSGNLNKWNVNAKKYSVSEIVCPWSADNYP